LSEDISDRDEVFDFLAEERRNRRDPEEHPSPEALTAYQANELSPEEDERIQDHLARCRHCTEMLLELEEFLQPVEEPEPAAASEPEDGSRLQEPPPAPTDTAYRSPFMLPLAASLIGALIPLILLGYISWRVLHLKREVTELQHQVAELQQPVVSPPTFRLRSTRGEGTPELPADRAVLLAFDAPVGDDYSEYRARIIDEEGTVRWEGRLPFLLITGYLKPGEYTVRVLGLRKGHLDPLQESRIRVPAHPLESQRR
jgi:hypothetical protein